MITTILSDFSRVILYPKDSNYTGKLNGLYNQLKETKKDFEFDDYFEFNEELLDLYTSLKSKYEIDIFTTGKIQEAEEVKHRIATIFDHVFSASDYCLDKTDPEAYRFIANKINKKTGEIVYIDDEVQNIFAAKKAGLHTILYIEFLKLNKEVTEILNL